MSVRGTLTLLVGLALAASCEPRGLLTQLEFAAPVRAYLVASCCDCLASATQTVPHPDLACPQDQGAARVDGGPLLATETRCLCTDDPDSQQCQDTLNSASSIEVSGRCIEPGGECEAACQGVLAYPEGS